MRYAFTELNGKWLVVDTKEHRIVCECKEVDDAELIRDLLMDASVVARNEVSAAQAGRSR